MIIGFSGKKRAGKTTCVRDLIEKTDGIFVERNFADGIKEIVGKTFFGTSIWSDQFKDEIIRGRTGRQWLQIVGTDWFRRIEPDCWVNMLFSGYMEDEEVWLIGDVRFPNEVEAIQSLDGHVIRLLRSPDSYDNHYSETALDDYEGFDVVINNTALSLEQQRNVVWDTIIRKGWLG